MKAVKKISIGAVIILLMAFGACQKNNLSAPNDAAALATNNAAIDNESNKVEDVVNSVAFSQGINFNGQKLEGGIISLLPSCATVTIDTMSLPHSMIINFGSTPCLCDQWDNRYRQGLVTVTWTGGYKESGTVISYTTKDYYRGDTPDQMNKIDLSKTVTNEGLNENGNLHYHIVTTGSMTTFDGLNSTWSSDKEKVWLQGSSTADRSDDIFSYTGTMSGTNLNGVDYTATIVDPLMKDACDWYISGTVEIARLNLPNVTLNYGDGICDDQATVTVNGSTKTITLH